MGVSKKKIDGLSRNKWQRPKERVENGSRTTYTLPSQSGGSQQLSQRLPGSVCSVILDFINIACFCKGNLPGMPSEMQQD